MIASNKPHSFTIVAGPLLLILVIDAMGWGLVFPILNGLIFDPHTTFLTHAFITPTMRHTIYGSIISIYMLCWFFGAATLGDLSDQIGRKKALLICLSGTFSSYLISAIAVSISSLTLIILGRVIAGFTAGSYPIAQAAIIDLSTPKNKTRYIGYILLAISLGFILGPLLGGILSDPHIVSWFNYAVPFYFSVVLSLLNLILLALTFKETSAIKKNSQFIITPHKAIKVFISAFTHEKVRRLSVIYFVFIFGWSSFNSFVALYLLKIYNFTSTEVSLYVATMGVGLGLAHGVLVNYFTTLFSLETNFKYMTLLCAILIFVMVSVHSELLNWILAIPITCCISVAYASMLSLFSNQVDAANQGWVMGIAGSILAFVYALNGILIGALATSSAKLPLFFASVGLAFTVLLSSILTFRSKSNPTK